MELTFCRSLVKDTCVCVWGFFCGEKGWAIAAAKILANITNNITTKTKMYFVKIKPTNSKHCIRSKKEKK